MAIATAAIAGVTAPVKGATPVATIAETSEYTATISWSPADATFAADTAYTATITITPKAGYTLTGVTENFFTVSGATATNAANSGVVTAVFPKTEAETKYKLFGTGATVTFKIGENTVTEAAENATVIAFVSGIMEGQQLLNLTVNGNKEGVTETVVGSTYSFTMPADNVTVEVTVGEPTKKVKIGGSSVLTLKNGPITKDSEGALTWSYFTEELTMNGYEGGYIHSGETGNVTETITIRVKGDTNKITAETEALLFINPNIIGSNKDNDKLTIEVSEYASRAIYYHVNVKNATLDIDVISTDYNPIRGVHGSATVDDGHLIVKVNKNSAVAKEAYGVTGSLTLKNGGTANIEVTGLEGTTRISTHNGAPWISDASKVVAEYTEGQGDTDKPFAMTVTVPSTVAKIKSQKDGLAEGESSILIGDSTTVTLYKSDNTTTAVDTITLSEDLTFYAKTSDNVWFKITVTKE